VPPDEIVVVWQGNDHPTERAARRIEPALPCRLIVRHSAEKGVVPAENTALEAASGELVLLIDDDATAPPQWLASHLRHYGDPAVGAVGGPANNFYPDGTPFPKRAAEPTGRLTWFGRSIGNMHDHIDDWQARPPAEVDHLVGYNLSLRRAAFDRFESGLKPYWQMFEAEACLQAKARGFKVIFDFANVVEHFPTNSVYAPGRDGDLRLKVYHSGYNHAYILSKYSDGFLRPLRLMYLLSFGSVTSPGLLASAVALRRYGKPLREMQILWKSWQYYLAGWRDGARK
jgi:glycosyltransferase involved in cell wall biosynthesis